MEKEVAQSLLSLAVALHQNIGDMYGEVRKFSDEEVRARFNKAIGT